MLRLTVNTAKLPPRNILQHVAIVKRSDRYIHYAKVDLFLRRHERDFTTEGFDASRFLYDVCNHCELYTTGCTGGYKVLAEENCLAYRSPSSLKKRMTVTLTTYESLFTYALDNGKHDYWWFIRESPDGQGLESMPYMFGNIYSSGDMCKGSTGRLSNRFNIRDGFEELMNGVWNHDMVPIKYKANPSNWLQVCSPETVEDEFSVRWRHLDTTPDHNYVHCPLSLDSYDVTDLVFLRFHRSISSVPLITSYSGTDLSDLPSRVREDLFQITEPLLSRYAYLVGFQTASGKILLETGVLFDSLDNLKERFAESIAEPVVPTTAIEPEEEPNIPEITDVEQEDTEELIYLDLEDEDEEYDEEDEEDGDEDHDIDFEESF